MKINHNINGNIIDNFPVPVNNERIERAATKIYEKSQNLFFGPVIVYFTAIRRDYGG
jgi:hypothetical protein